MDSAYLMIFLMFAPALAVLLTPGRKIVFVLSVLLLSIVLFFTVSNNQETARHGTFGGTMADMLLYFMLRTLLVAIAVRATIETGFYLFRF